MDLDYDDYAHGGMSLIPQRKRLPYRYYKLTEEFEQKQLWKPQHKSRNPNGTAIKTWRVQGGTCIETQGTRWWFGECVDCHAWICRRRDASAPEFRGKGNVGPRGRWPKFCELCRVRRREESLQRRSAAKRAADRDRIAVKREVAGRDADFEAENQPRIEAARAEEAAYWAAEAAQDREAHTRYRHRRGVRSPYDRF